MRILGGSLFLETEVDKHSVRKRLTMARNFAEMQRRRAYGPRYAQKRPGCIGLLALLRPFPLGAVWPSRSHFRAEKGSVTLRKRISIFDGKLHESWKCSVR